eukprot:TRINITY_DN6301_c0_g1_i1.p1 TRINITY_DN6301_c0_g1~~TRINITY_DN6301_c0_g1_i1.p1  ORF type:complete len:687 (-),score=94.93 TRINITY_DN6301_c0_g1_i1:114-1943(-)
MKDPSYHFDIPEPNSPEEIFWRMIEDHDIAGVMKAIETSSVDPSVHKCHGLYLACQEGLVELVQFYLSQTHPKYEIQADNPIAPACENNHVEVVRLMMMHPAINPADDRSFSVQVATQAGHSEVLKMLLQCPKVDPTIYDDNAFKMAAQNGHIETVRVLLEHPKVNPNAEDNFALQMACDEGHTEIVKILLENNPDNPADSVNSSLSSACQRGHTEVVRELLKYQNTAQVTIRNDICLRIACYSGHYEIVQMLLNFDGVKPESENNDALLAACEGGHASIAELLLTFPQVDPSQSSNAVLEAACRGGNLELVEVLLKDPRVLASDLEEAIFVSSASGHLDVLKKMLSVSTVQPNIGHLEEAISGGHADIVKYLLSIPNLEIPDNILECYTPNPEIVDFLYQDERVKKDVDIGEVLFDAIYQSNHHVVSAYLSKDLWFSNCPSDVLTEAIRMSANSELFGALLADPRFIPDGTHLEIAMSRLNFPFLSKILNYPNLDYTCGGSNKLISIAASNSQTSIVRSLFMNPSVDQTRAIKSAPHESEKLLYLVWHTWPKFRQLLIGFSDPNSSFSEIIEDLRVLFIEAIPRAYRALLVPSRKLRGAHLRPGVVLS